tara:strand:- start:1677 stop:2195 length:519 start_codon:yes stop_codon:yes gene_type:complete
MSNRFGNAWIELLYDLDLEVKETSPSSESMEVHDIKPKKYLVLQGTDTIFPGNIFSDSDKVNYERRNKVGVPNEGGNYPIVHYEGEKVKDTEVGGTFHATLIKRVADIEDELIINEIPRTDGVNSITFEPGELEKRLENVKSELFKKLNNAGVTTDESKVYFRLRSVSTNLY